jgi:hypothetical protein
VSGRWAHPGWVALAAAGAVAACAAWALWPLVPPDALDRADTGDGSPGAVEPAETATLALDTGAFRAPLWLAPPPPPPKQAPQQPPPPPPPLRLQLVGIVVEEGGSRAVLYDPDTDVLHIASAGQPVGRCTVESVTPAEVTLREGELLRTLALRDDQTRGAGR